MSIVECRAAATLHCGQWHAFRFHFSFIYETTDARDDPIITSSLTRAVSLSSISYQRPHVSRTSISLSVIVSSSLCISSPFILPHPHSSPIISLIYFLSFPLVISLSRALLLSHSHHPTSLSPVHLTFAPTWLLDIYLRINTTGLISIDSGYVYFP